MPARKTSPSSVQLNQEYLENEFIPTFKVTYRYSLGTKHSLSTFPVSMILGFYSTSGSHDFFYMTIFLDCPVFRPLPCLVTHTLSCCITAATRHASKFQERGWRTLILAPLTIWCLLAPLPEWCLSFFPNSPPFLRPSVPKLHENTVNYVSHAIRI